MVEVAQRSFESAAHSASGVIGRSSSDAYDDFRRLLESLYVQPNVAGVIDPECVSRVKQLWTEIDSISAATFNGQTPPIQDAIQDCDRRIAALRKILDRLDKIKQMVWLDVSDQQRQTLDSFIIFQENAMNAAQGMKRIYTAVRANNLRSKLSGYVEGLIIHCPTMLYSFQDFISRSRATGKADLAYAQSISDATSVLTFVIKDVEQIIRNISLSQKTRNQLLRYQNQIITLAKYTHDDLERLQKGEEFLGFVVLGEEGKRIILSPQSAEAKAIQRVHDNLDDDEWQIVHKPGDAINIGAIRDRLKNRVNQ